MPRKPNPNVTDEQRAYYRERSRKWRVANREKALAIGRDSMKRAAARRAVAAGRVPGKSGAQKKFSESEKRAKRNEKSKLYYVRNREKALEASKARQKAQRRGLHVSKAKPRLTDEQRRIVNVTMAANRRARLRNNGGKHTRQDIENLIVSQNGCCAMCRIPFGEDGYHVDHVIPLAAGGSNGRENIQLLHPTCNLKKGAMIAPDATHLASC